MQINRRNDAHIRLSPFAPAVRYLAFEKLERIESEFWLRDFQSAAQDRAAFVLHEEERAVGFSFGDFLEDA